MKRLLVLILGAIFLAIVSVIWWKYTIRPIVSDCRAQECPGVEFAIQKGEGVREVARRLREKGLIRDQVAFFLLIKKLGLDNRIQAGNFALHAGMGAYDIAVALTHGTEDIWVTIPEGWRTEEVVEYLQKKWESKNSKIDLHLSEWKAREGKIFPETYRIPLGIKEEEFLNLVDKTFKEKFSSLSSLSGKNKNDLSDKEVIILASLVEREAKFAEDRPQMADILIKRYQAGMALQIDATVQYAIGKTHDNGWWKKELTIADLKFISPYNTYLNAGLPPGPICNPGIAALEAVMYPTPTEYWYYLSDKTGKTHYAKTLMEHNENIRKYLSD